MDALKRAIHETPIIDNHAHNLLRPEHLDAIDFLSITSEATGNGLQQSKSTLAHIRAVKQLSEILQCEANWTEVTKAIEAKRQLPNDSWAKQCFEGIETVLIDDGLDSSRVYDYAWHDRLTRSKCRRIVRIESVVEGLIHHAKQEYRQRKGSVSVRELRSMVLDSFVGTIERAILDTDIAGFKSVICYRTGLSVPSWTDDLSIDADNRLIAIIEDETQETFGRLEDSALNAWFLHHAARSIEISPCRKPLQFHTGLGDNDINLELSNPAHLQSFIKTYPHLVIVLLHASYPFTTEAGYLSCVYENVYLDIGEVFPLLSQDGQERVIREALDLCPSEKLLWSTDGHFFPETYLLAVIQVKEGLEHVLCEYVERKAITSIQAIRIVQDLFFHTANRIYKLDIGFTPAFDLEHVHQNPPLAEYEQSQSFNRNYSTFADFLLRNPSIKYVRLQWLDYTSTLRVRILPIRQAADWLRHRINIGITKAVFGLLQSDILIPGFSPIGNYHLCPDFASLRLSGREGHATMQCEFREENGASVNDCPRTALRRQVDKAFSRDITFLVGYEIEVTFMRKSITDGGFAYGGTPVNEGGHAWSTARALESDAFMDIIETIVSKLEHVGIDLQQFHPESAPGQFEFVLTPLPPLVAADTLVAAREIISLIASNAGLRATLYPKPFPNACGNGAHMHISMSPDANYEQFYAGVLANLPSMSAILYSNVASYERIVDGAWAGGSWITWGPQNRETPLRQIEGSHFEIKCIDGLANPYLVSAAILAAGLHGLSDRSLLQAPCMVDPAGLGEDERSALGIKHRFPKDIIEALNLLAGSNLADMLGPEVVATYLSVKRGEHEMLIKMDRVKRRNWLIERY